MTTTPDLRNADAVAALFRQAADYLGQCRYRRGSTVRIPGRGRLLVTGDLHDNPVHLAKIRSLAKLDDGPGNHLILHEVIHSERLVNGVDLSHRMLARVATLVRDHPEQVHPLLANHELSQMTGAGVSKGAGNSVELFNHGLEFVYGDAWPDVAEAINVFILAMPLALVSDSGLLCAHSLPSPRGMDRFDPGVLERPLTDADYERGTGSAYLMAWGRGHTPEQIESLAATWGVSLFCLGHQHVDTGCEMRGSRVVILNSDHDGAAVLPLDLADLPTAEAAMMMAIPLRALSVPEA